MNKLVASVGALPPTYKGIILIIAALLYFALVLALAILGKNQFTPDIGIKLYAGTLLVMWIKSLYKFDQQGHRCLASASIATIVAVTIGFYNIETARMLGFAFTITLVLSLLLNIGWKGNNKE